MSGSKLVFVGTIVTSNPIENLSVTSGFLVVEDGKIVRRGSKRTYDELEIFEGYEIIELTPDQLLMPGFVDCHTHAPQFPNIGLGLDQPLLNWLDEYTFPLEMKYKNERFAAKVYDQVVRKLLDNGTTTACYFGTLHLEGTLELVKSVIEKGQRALVGKVSMNIKNDAGYYNHTEDELEQVETFIQKVMEYENDLVQPVVTPRFAVSCNTELMTGLANLAREYGVMRQSHISENLKEIEHVLNTNPECGTYGEVYDKCQILNDKCIMAHAVHLTTEEITLLAAKGVSVAHCPASNTRLRSGLCPVRKLIDANIKVGLGTDVSGGDSPSILDAIRRTMDVSTHIELMRDQPATIDWKEAFYLATLGGARALNLDTKIGSLEVGKDFDAMIVDVYNNGGPVDRYEYSMDTTPMDIRESLAQRFIYLGNDRNIVRVYVKGQKVKDICPKTTVWDMLFC